MLIRKSGSSPPKTFPIIAVTANVFREGVERCHEAGMNARMGKPPDFDAVMAISRKFLLKGRKKLTTKGTKGRGQG
jgi:CheY-like chemotaxis protein